MAMLKCKMCGGDLNVVAGVSVCECEYCGTKQTVPAANDEKKLVLFARANRLRLECDFDKAAGVYEAIVADFSDEAEAYWGLVLCRYGIEYVDDPKTGKKIPTCHRSSFESVLEDNNFQMALDYADPMAREVYREEARQIEQLRRGIIAVSSKEEPYDIFICYKETDDKGQRTIDSVIAQDVYAALTEKGYRVFFSRISLEDKLGVEYEPYIFAALHSSKVMLAFGTSYEHYTAVWVKNEWSRYLQLIEKGEKKMLIPCYKDIDPYDMPKEFAKLQAQDMGKVGAMQDLLRGIEKIMKHPQVPGEARIDVIQQQLMDMVETDRNKERTKKKRLIFAFAGTVLLGLIGYFVLYPWFASLSGNYSVYINMYHVEEYEISERVTTIQDHAFANCTSLRTVTIPDSVTQVGNGAFLNCYNLTDVTIGNGVTEFGADIFSGCDMLKSVTINSNINSALLMGTDVQSVTIGDDVSVIADRAFSGCAKLETVTIGSGVTAFGYELFEGCISLSTASINSDVGTGLFKNTEITTAIIGDEVTSIGMEAFQACQNLTQVSIGKNVVNIGKGAFSGCYSLPNITIPDSVTILGDEAFLDCMSLTEVTIGDEVTQIGFRTFANCKGLKQVHIPAGIRKIDSSTFDGCNNLYAFNYDGTIAQWNSMMVLFRPTQSIIIRCSDGTTYRKPN